MKTLIVAIPLLLVGCANSMSWVNMPKRGAATLEDAGLVFIQSDNTLKGGQRSLERAREAEACRPSPRFRRDIEALSAVIGEAEALRGIVETLGDHWHATGRMPATWHDEQQKWLDVLEAMEHAAERTYSRSATVMYGWPAPRAVKCTAPPVAKQPPIASRAPAAAVAEDCNIYDSRTDCMQRLNPQMYARLIGLVLTPAEIAAYEEHLRTREWVEPYAAYARATAQLLAARNPAPTPEIKEQHDLAISCMNGMRGCWQHTLEAREN